MRRSTFACAPIGAFVAVALGLAPVAAGATTYYVNGACGNDGWLGTSPLCAAPDGPKATISAAVGLTADGDEVVVADGVYIGSANRPSIQGRSIVLRSANGSGSCTIDCGGSGRGIRATGAGESVTVMGFTIVNGVAEPGGGILAFDANLTVIDCHVANCSADRGGGVWSQGGNLSMTGCTITGNVAEHGIGGVAAFDAELASLRGCTFTANSSGSIGALALAVTRSDVVNCLFNLNDGQFVAGAIADGSGTSTMANCVFSRNVAGMGSAVSSGTLGSAIVNCAFSDNQGTPIESGYSHNIHLFNSIVWGSGSLGADAPEVTAASSNLQGGWPGPGNIDAEPLFVAAGIDDLRLANGSPCVDAGADAALPPDALDLDGDGDTKEPLPLDLDGNPRVGGSSVDIGAYEGEFEASVPASGTSDLDEGEFEILVPEGTPFDPVETPAAFVVNLSGGDDGVYTVSQHASALHAGAGGYNELSDILVLETTLPDGSYITTAFIAFDQGDVSWAGPLALDVTAFDAATGHWWLAVAGNAQDSPGHTGPVGDRFVVQGTGDDFGVSTDLGDHGVYWNPELRQGFVWANLDRAGDVAVGNPRCAGDCSPEAGDGEVAMRDVLALLQMWGAGAGSGGGGVADFDADGVVAVADLSLLLEGWGACEAPEEAAAGGPAPPADVGRDRDVTSALGAGMDRIRTAWGSGNGGLAADLDGDGVVGVRDLLGVLGAAGLD